MNKPVNDKDLVQLITGACSPRQRARIERWLDQKPEHRERLNKLRETWAISGELELHQQEDETWDKISQRISNPRHLTIHRLADDEDAVVDKNKDKVHHKSPHPEYRPSTRPGSWLSGVAVACLLIVGALYLLYDYGLLGEQQNLTGERAMQKVAADRGERVNLTLSDGTSVVLNSSSTIRYPSDFDGSNREVELEGEAFFSVTTNERKPFLVHTPGAVVRVLGTKFNVNAYADFDGVEVVVEDGSVAVASDSLTKQEDSALNDGDEVILGKGEYTIVREGAGPTSPVDVSLDHYVGWINGDLIFEATPLDRVIKKLGRYYNRDFEVADSSLLDRKLTVSFKKESLSRVLEVLSVAMDVTYKQKDSLIYLESYE